MEIKPVTDPAFAIYGKVVEGYAFAPLVQKLVEVSEKPADQVIYVPTDKALEELAIYRELTDRMYGGMPVQIGYCNGSNHKLNCLEYHRGSEINVAADDVILLVAPLWKVRDRQLDTAEVQAFLVPAGTAVQLYETALHYAPCNGPGSDGFRVIIVLPRDTNTEIPLTPSAEGEDRLLWGRNKWLIAHPDTDEAANGAWTGLRGENITV